MKLKQVFTDDDAVSPVIGVILMVAITVILAAVIGTFVLGLGGNLGNSAPSATLAFEWEAGNQNSSATENYADNRSYTVVHDGGEEVKNSTINIQEEGADFPSIAYGGKDVYAAGDTLFNRSNLGGASKWNNDRGPASEGDTVQVVWSASDSDKSTVLLEDDVPQ